MTDASKIIYTYTDEAPALATHSFLPIVEAYAGACGVAIETADISLAARILAVFGDHLTEEQRVPDALAELGELAKTPQSNIIKLPNISASIPQLKAAIKELQAKGFEIPDYPDEPSTDAERDAKARYDQVKGSAVNPVIRMGNSDRRAPAAVKQYARNNPHSMGEWSSDSTSHVASMSSGDFRSHEKSVTVAEDGAVSIRLVGADGETTALAESVEVEAGEVLDATYMSKAALLDFLREQVADADDKGVLFSLHMKATMMKVSDPIIFGHAVRVFFADVFERYADELERAGANPNDGLGGVISAVEQNLDADTATAITDAIAQRIKQGPDLAYVNSHKGITNLHVPSDVIIDASMPAMIRSSGQMWNADDETQDTKAVIPDSSYAALYAETIDFCRENGAFDPTTMGTVQNVGLMARKAEEYGSHDKTFEIPADGTVQVVDSAGNVLMEHRVSRGDIWRACQTKDDAIRDWVKLAVTRARATGWPAVFWLDDERAHDAQLIEKVNTYLGEHDTDGLDIRIMDVAEATRFSLERAKAGEDTISVTGNVLRDYLTDLFPILELGTSAKMLSIVPLMAGGGLFETGAGGSAPKHVQQFTAENHLRWDSLGEYLALAVSLEQEADLTGNPGAKVLGEALDAATARYLQDGKSPSRKVGELDNRGSAYYVALYWAQALAEQSDDTRLAEVFAPLAKELGEAEDTIVAELDDVQGQPVDVDGYYYWDRAKVDEAMRPSETFNRILSDFAASSS
ncbi:NADP-dependent isocitrate dehydrogenase [Euzebya sp.]|uniref:NADP-dependent isocitrate dehydrogenase n=1 Tax=Euzebya sp. TaxID=1971409 RepID=UPI0035123AF4